MAAARVAGGNNVGSNPNAHGTESVRAVRRHSSSGGKRHSPLACRSRLARLRQPDPGGARETSNAASCQAAMRPVARAGKAVCTCGAGRWPGNRGGVRTALIRWPDDSQDWREHDRRLIRLTVAQDMGRNGRCQPFPWDQERRRTDRTKSDRQELTPRDTRRSAAAAGVPGLLAPR